MGFIGTAEVGTNAFGQLLRREDPIAFDDLAFAMDPLGFNRVEPGTLLGQPERQNAHSGARLLDLPVVSPDPGPHVLARMPGGVIPDQQPVPDPLLGQALGTPVQKLRGDATHRTPRDEAQPDLGAIGLFLAPSLPQDPVAGQGFGVGIGGAPGLLDQAHGLLAEDLSVVAITPPAERWLAEIAEMDSQGKQAVPNAVAAVVGRLQAQEQGIDAQLDLLPRLRLRTASGQWLVLHASRLSAPGQIAVIFEVARPAEIAPLIMQVYDLSKREGETMQLVVRGFSTAEISGAFHISANTVQDHLKAIFEKTGVRSRRELVGHLFAQHY